MKHKAWRQGINATKTRTGRNMVSVVIWKNEFLVFGDKLASAVCRTSEWLWTFCACLLLYKYIVHLLYAAAHSDIFARCWQIIFALGANWEQRDLPSTVCVLHLLLSTTCLFSHSQMYGCNNFAKIVICKPVMYMYSLYPKPQLPPQDMIQKLTCGLN